LLKLYVIKTSVPGPPGCGHLSPMDSARACDGAANTQKAKTRTPRMHDLEIFFTDWPDFHRANCRCEERAGGVSVAGTAELSCFLARQFHSDRVWR
jgi:hypothetical protein